MEIERVVYMSKTYTMLMNKLEVSIRRGEELSNYYDLADAYLRNKRITVEEYELVIQRIETAYDEVE